jgi:hypothetical protein
MVKMKGSVQHGMSVFIEHGIYRTRSTVKETCHKPKKGQQAINTVLLMNS